MNDDDGGMFVIAYVVCMFYGILLGAAAVGFLWWLT